MVGESPFRGRRIFCWPKIRRSRGLVPPPSMEPRLPFIDLHRHLDGNMRLSTILDLARQHRIRLPADTPEGLREAARTRHTFEEYRRQLSELRGDDVLEGELPRDPAYLSYTLAATCLLTLQERQALLEAASPLERLIMLRHALVEEMRAMRAIPSLPATEVARTSWSPN